MTALDTHEIVKELKAAGFTDAQAEAVTRVVKRSHDIDLSELATKTDLKAEILAIRAEIFATRTDLKAQIAEAKTDVVKWMFGTIGFQTLIILGPVIALARVVH